MGNTVPLKTTSLSIPQIILLLQIYWGIEYGEATPSTIISLGKFYTLGLIVGNKENKGWVFTNKGKECIEKIIAVSTFRQ